MKFILFGKLLCNLVSLFVLTNTNLTNVQSGNIIGTPILDAKYKLINGYIIGPKVNLANADLTDADLTGADLTDVTSGNIIGTPNLPTSYFIIKGFIIGPGVDLNDVDLTGANLTGIDFSGFNLSGIDLLYR